MIAQHLTLDLEDNLMSLDRRDFMKFSALSALALSFNAQRELPSPIAQLKPMTGNVKPIAREEYLQRQEKARGYMRDAGIDAIFLTGGSSLSYFTNIQWGISERLFGMVFPAKGEPAYISPAFERGRALEQIKFGTD